VKKERGSVVAEGSVKKEAVSGRNGFATLKTESHRAKKGKQHQRGNWRVSPLTRASGSEGHTAINSTIRKVRPQNEEKE